jgi:hypothetical protein
MRRILALVVLAACGGGQGGNDAAIDSPPGGDAAIDSVVEDAPDDAMIDAMPPDPSPPRGSCNADGWCWVLPLPQGNELSAVWAGAPNDVWAVGMNVIMHYDGSNWTTYPMSYGLPQQLIVRSSTDIWVSTSKGVERFDGSTWATIIPRLASSSFLRIDSVGTEIWAHSSNGQIRRWDGATIHEIPSPGAGWVTAAFFGTAAEPWALATDGRRARWLGAAWAVTAPNAAGESVNAAVIDATNVAIVYSNSQSSAVSVWNGTSFELKAGLPNHRYETIAARSADDIWTCANFLCAHWNGVEWTTIVTSEPSSNDEVTGVAIDSAGSLWTVQEDARVETLNGTTWSEKTNIVDHVGEVWGFADDDIWTFGLRQQVQVQPLRHWDGTQWTTQMLDFGFNVFSYKFNAVWSSGPNDIWIAAGKTVTNATECRMLHWNGSVWTDTMLASQFDPGNVGMRPGFTSVWGSSATDIYATDPTGSTTLWHYNGSQWTSIANRGGSVVTGTAANNVVVIAGSVVKQWNGSQWTLTNAPAPVERVWVNSPTDIWLTGLSTATDSYHFDGQFFVTLTGLGGALFGGSSSKMYGFDFTIDGEKVTEWLNGPGGTSTTTQSLSAVPGASWVSPSGRIYVGGRGLITHP